MIETRRSIVALLALGVALAAVGAARAQENQAESGADSSSSGTRNSNDRQDRDAEPDSVQEQMESVKRALRGETVDLSKAAPIRDHRHQFQVRVPNYIQIRQQNIVMQQRDYSCGAACLATICRYYWEDDVTEVMVLGALDELLTPAEIDERIENGLAMTDLRRAAVKLGYQAVVGKLTFEKLTEVKVPVIVGIQPSGHKHFVVYRGTDMDWIYMADPIRGNIRMPVWEFRKQWQKNAVLVVHKPGRKVREYSPLSLRPFDVDRTQLNDYLIQTQPTRQPQPRIKTSP